MKSVALIGVAAAVLIGGGVAVKKQLSKPKKQFGYYATVKRAPIEETVEATGSVSPLNRVEIKPPIAGRIEKLIVDEGATVKAGQIIAWMSSTDRAAILDAARAQGPDELKKWEDTYKATPIIAPLPGIIILRNVVEGQTVDPTIVLYAMSDTLIVVAQVDESDIGRVHVGMEARTVLDSYPDKVSMGKVFDILYEGKNVSNVIQYYVKIKPDSVPAYFRSQMTANISFIVKKKEDALVVPAAAVKDAPGGVKQVVVASNVDGEPPVARDIKTGVETGESVEVLDGLDDGDRVFISRAKYTPQQQAASSPLMMGGKPSGPTGQAPKSKK